MTSQVVPRPCGKEPGISRLNDTWLDRATLWICEAIILGGGIIGLVGLWLRVGGCCI